MISITEFSEYTGKVNNTKQFQNTKINDIE